MEWITAVLDRCLYLYQEVTAWGASLRGVEWVVMGLLFLSYLELGRIRIAHEGQRSAVESIRETLDAWRFDWDRERRPPLP